jgi:hypothetical protein
VWAFGEMLLEGEDLAGISGRWFNVRGYNNQRLMITRKT